MSTAPLPWHQPPRGEDEAAWIAWMHRLPYFAAFGVRCEAIQDGVGRFGLPEAPMGPNPNGSVNGGVLAAVIDQVMGATCMRYTEAGGVVNTASLDVRYQRPAFAPLTLDATVSKAGSRLIFVEVVVRDRDGAVTNTASGTMAVIGPRPS